MKCGRFQRMICFVGIILLFAGFGRSLQAEGMKLFQQKKFESAAAKFTEAIAKKPDAKSYFFRAASYSAMNRFPEAIADYNKVIEINPDYENVYWSRGYCYANMEQFPEAAGDYTLALKKNPGKYRPMIYGMRAKVYGRLNDWVSAQSDLEAALKEDPDNGEYLGGLEYVKSRRNAPPEREWTEEEARAEALKDYQKTLDVSKIPPSDPDFEENAKALSRGGGRANLKGRFLTSNEDGSYVVSYFNENGLPRETFFFDIQGGTQSYRIFSSPSFPRAAYIYCYDSCPRKDETKKPYGPGELSSISFHPSAGEMFYFDESGTLLMHDKK